MLIVAPLGAGQHVGFIVNRPTDATLGKLFPEHAASQKIVDPVYLGGPIEPGVIFALVQRARSPGGNSFALMPSLYAAFKAKVVDNIIESNAQHARFVAGLVAWRPGGLKAEIDLGAWLVLEPDAAILTREPGGLREELVRRSQAAPEHYLSRRSERAAATGLPLSCKSTRNRHSGRVARASSSS